MSIFYTQEQPIPHHMILTGVDLLTLVTLEIALAELKAIRAGTYVEPLDTEQDRFTREEAARTMDRFRTKYQVVHYKISVHEYHEEQETLILNLE